MLLGSAVQLNAQTEKGKVMLGSQSSMAFSSATTTNEPNGSSYGKTKTKQLDIAPQVAYFTINNLAIGLQIPFNYTKETLGDYSSSMNSLSVSSFVKYYFGKTKIKPYLIGSVGPGWGKTTTSNIKQYNSGATYQSFEDGDIKLSLDYFSYELGGGFAIFLNEHISVDFGIGYKSATSKWEYNKYIPNTNGKTTTNGISAKIGIVVCL